MSCEVCDLKFCHVLGLGGDCDYSQLRERYRRLARKFHPDAGYKGGSSAIKEINSCYDKLEKRRLPLAVQTSSLDKNYSLGAPGIYFLEK